MFTIIPSLVLVLVLVLPLAAPSVLTPSTSQELQVGGHRTQRDTKQDTIKVERASLGLMDDISVNVLS